MKKLRIKFKKIKLLLVNLILVLFISKPIFSNDILFEIQGNQYTDSEVIISLLKDIPDNLDAEFTNDIIKVLYQSNLFSDVSVNFKDNKYIIKVKEFPNINKLYFDNNKRFKDDDLKLIATQLNFTIFNEVSTSLFIDETKKLYESFGYNNVNIDYSEKINEETNTVDLYFNIEEGNITNINKIIFDGNEKILSQEIYAIIKSRTKSIRNFFVNNNYKRSVVERDKFLITNYYKNNGFLDVTVDLKIEYLENNRVNLYYNIFEGKRYNLSSIDIIDTSSLLNPNISNLIFIKINNFLKKEKVFSLNKIDKLRDEISTIIIDNGVEFFEINYSEKRNNQNIDLTFEIITIKPKYTKQINIIGNTRTFDYVIRRELNIGEGDALHQSQIDNIRQNLISLDIFESVTVKEEIIDNNNVNLIIEVEEKSTGSLNAGVAVDTLEGFSIVTGLNENNFYGTGRSVDVLVNTSDNKNQFKFITSNRLSYENEINLNFAINYRQQDLSKSSSYKLDTFSSGVGLGYKLNKRFYHNIDLEYVLKDYQITNASTVSESISNSSGTNMSYLIKNNFRFSSVNPGFIPKEGNKINFSNIIETPTSSSNGFVRSAITIKQYYSLKNSIFSIQTKFGNIFSLNNNDILSDDKFALGGRWLRGFDSFGAGPRNSRTSYVGGNNIAAAKFDYSYEFTKNVDFPVYLNLFNDYGYLWDNKTKPTHSNNTLRSSAGFGIKFYSPLGPIGFSWGFPVMDEEYDIKRMFLFSIGNID